MICDKRILFDEATVVYDHHPFRVMQPAHFPGILRLDVRVCHETVGWIWRPLIAIRAEDVREIESLADGLHSVADEFTGAAYESVKAQAAESTQHAAALAADRRVIRQQMSRVEGGE